VAKKIKFYPRSFGGDLFLRGRQDSNPENRFWRAAVCRLSLRPLAPLPGAKAPALARRNTLRGLASLRSPYGRNLGSSPPWRSDIMQSIIVFAVTPLPKNQFTICNFTLSIFQILFNDFLSFFSPFFNFLMIPRQKNFRNFPINSFFWRKNFRSCVLGIFNKPSFYNSFF